MEFEKGQLAAGVYLNILLSSHKMYITINNIKGENRIGLSYSIQNFDSGREVAVIATMLNTRY